VMATCQILQDPASPTSAESEVSGTR
jgi:hypothetical protein